MQLQTAEPRAIAEERDQLGENPLWHPLERRLYWTDILGKKLLRYDPKTNKREVAFEGRTVGGFTIQANGTMLLFMDKGGISILHGDHLHDVVKELPDEIESRFNDVIADPAGRVFCGTMSSPAHKGALYRLDRDGTITKVVDGIGISNGLGFSRGAKRLYYTDSDARTIDVFDYDRRSGGLSNRRVFVDVHGEAMPDGMTLDADGYLWSAMWNGSALVRYDEAGTEVQRIAFPAKKVTSVTFGGDSLATMYVTTAAWEQAPGEDLGAGAGQLFELTVPGVRGLPEYVSRIDMRPGQDVHPAAAQAAAS